MWRAGLAWQRLCDVDAEPLAAWLAESRSWTDNASQVSRVWDVPAELIAPILAVAFAQFGQRVRQQELSLNRIAPGVLHGMHVDWQRWDWLTRIHVPILTNPGVWHQFDGDERTHFDVGGAYSFDTMRRHAFGNEGGTDRVHLVFDVIRALG